MTSRVATRGPVLIWGTGLIGTSVALALRAEGVDVFLHDPSPTSLALAADMGAGTPLPAAGEGTVAPALIVVAAPPDVAAESVVEVLESYPSAVVTDVASVKDEVERSVAEQADEADLARYVGSHPMAGRDRSGATYAVADLFYGQPWVIVPTRWSSPEAVLAVRNLASDLGAFPLEMTPAEHDRAVAYVSHVPQLVSSLLAGRLLEAPADALSLAGQGLRDTTRIAASDPRLWTAIISGNAAQVSAVLRDLAADLGQLVESLDEYTQGTPGAVGAVSEVISAGNQGRSRIPGKHGGAQRRWGEVEVLVPDKPGELGRLFSELGDARINIEDLALEHAAGKRFGIATIMVDPADLTRSVEELELRGWRIINFGAAGA